MSTQELMWRQVIEAVERALCKLRKVEQLEDVTMTVEEAAQILGISRGLAYDRVNNKSIPSITLNRRKLVPIISLARLLVEAEEQARTRAQVEDAV